MIYRRNSPTSDFYTPVPGSIRTLDLSHRVANTFRCRTEALPGGIQIQENDIVGACVKDRGDVSPLYLVGDTNDNSNNFNLYQVDRSGFDDCRDSQIGSVDTGHSNFIPRREFILHVYANIGKSCHMYLVLYRNCNYTQPIVYIGSPETDVEIAINQFTLVHVVSS